MDTLLGAVSDHAPPQHAGDRRVQPGAPSLLGHGAGTRHVLAHMTAPVLFSGRALRAPADGRSSGRAATPLLKGEGRGEGTSGKSMGAMTPNAANSRAPSASVRHPPGTIASAELARLALSRREVSRASYPYDRYVADFYCHAAKLVVDPRTAIRGTVGNAIGSATMTTVAPR